VLGALVADAAALGLHWIYDRDWVRELGTVQPEFREPDLAHYRKKKAFFAHKGKHAGDPSHYGEQLLVGLRSRRDGAFDPARFERRFLEAFGPGGTWVGYIDYATRETLRNLDDAERAALGTARAFDLGPHEEQRALVEAKVMANAPRWRGAELDRAMERAVRITHPDDDALVATAQAMARAVAEARTGLHGSDDVQLPAVSRLPALGAHLDAGNVAAAVRVTNDNDEAVRWAEVAAAMLRAAHAGATPREAAEASGLPAVTECADAAEAVEHYGIACNLDAAVPLTAVLLRDARDYTGAVRDNILLGGDSCGRGLLLGAVLGPAGGIPQKWLARTRAAREARELLG